MWLSACGMRQYGRLLLSQRAIPSLPKLVLSLHPSSASSSPLSFPPSSSPSSTSLSYTTLWSLDAFPLWGRRRSTRASDMMYGNRSCNDASDKEGKGFPAHASSSSISLCEQRYLLVSTDALYERENSPGRTVVCQVLGRPAGRGGNPWSSSRGYGELEVFRSNEEEEDSSSRKRLATPANPQTNQTYSYQQPPQPKIDTNEETSIAFNTSQATIGCGTMCNGLLAIQITSKELRVVSGIMPSLLLGEPLDLTAFIFSSENDEENLVDTQVKKKKEKGEEEGEEEEEKKKRVKPLRVVQARIYDPYIVVLYNNRRLRVWKLNQPLSSSLCEDLLEVYSEHQQHLASLEGLDEQERRNLCISSSFSISLPTPPPRLTDLFLEIPSSHLPLSLRQSTAHIKSIQLLNYTPRSYHRHICSSSFHLSEDPMKREETRDFTSTTLSSSSMIGSTLHLLPNAPTSPSVDVPMTSEALSETMMGDRRGGGEEERKINQVNNVHSPFQQKERKDQLPFSSSKIFLCVVMVVTDRNTRRRTERERRVRRRNSSEGESCIPLTFLRIFDLGSMSCVFQSPDLLLIPPVLRNVQETPEEGGENISVRHPLTGADNLTAQEKALLDAGRAGTCLTADPRLERVRCTVSRLRRDCATIMERSSPKALAETEEYRERKNGEDEEEETGRKMMMTMGEKKIPAKRQKVDNKVSRGGLSNEEGEKNERGDREDGDSIRNVKIKKETNEVEHSKREEEEGTPRKEEKEEEEKKMKRERLSETWVLNELLEEVLGAELVDLNPSEDDGPTLVVFITGRPILIYRAFSSLISPSNACHSDQPSPLPSSAQEQSSSTSSLPVGHPSSSSSSSPLSWTHDSHSSRGRSSEARSLPCSSFSFSSPFPEAHPSFPFRFALVPHDVAHPLPSRPLSLSTHLQSSSHIFSARHRSTASSSEGDTRGDDSEIDQEKLHEDEEEEEALPSTCTGYVVPYMGIGGCGRGALIIPPVNTPQGISAGGSSLFSSRQNKQERGFSSGVFSDKRKDEEDTSSSSPPSPPILWLTSERNQVFIHPHARKDIIAMAPFHVESSTPQGFFALSRESSRLELCDLLLSPSLNILPSCFSSRPSSSSSSQLSPSCSPTPPSAFPLRISLKASLPTAAIPLNATPTHVCISAGSLYVHPLILSAYQKALGSKKKGLGSVYTQTSSQDDDLLPKIFISLSPQRRHSTIPFISLYNRYKTSLSSPHGGGGRQAGMGSGGDSHLLQPSQIDCPLPSYLRGRLIAVAVWHEGAEVPMVEECLTERNALQLEQLELEGKKRLTTNKGQSDPSQGQGNNENESGLENKDLLVDISPNPYLVACTNKRIEAAHKLGKIYEIRLYHEMNMEAPIASYTLRTCEEVMSSSFISLDGVEYLGVGVGVPLSEQIECSGRLYLFKIPAVCTPSGSGNTLSETTSTTSSSSGSSASSTAMPPHDGNTLQGDEVLNAPPERLDLLADIVLNGPVTVVGGFFSSPTERSYIVHTVGSRLFVHEMEGNKFLRGAFSDASVCITDVANTRNFFLVADALKGLSLVSWQYDSEGDSRKITNIARTFPRCDLPVMSCGFISLGQDLGMLATDINGNVRLFSYNANKTTPGFEKLDILRCDGEDHCADGCLTRLRPLTIDSETVAILGEGVDGSSFLFRLVPPEDFPFLQSLQDRMAGYLPSPLGLNPLSARLPSGNVSLWTKISFRQGRHCSSSLRRSSYSKKDSVLTSRKRMLDLSLLKSLPFLSVPVLEGLLKPLLIEEEEDIRAEEEEEDEEKKKDFDGCIDDQQTSLSQFQSPAALRAYLASTGFFDGGYTRLLS